MITVRKHIFSALFIAFTLHSAVYSGGSEKLVAECLEGGRAVLETGVTSRIVRGLNRTDRVADIENFFAELGDVLGGFEHGSLEKYPRIHHHFAMAYYPLFTIFTKLGGLYTIKDFDVSAISKRIEEFDDLIVFFRHTTGSSISLADDLFLQKLHRLNQQANDDILDSPNSFSSSLSAYFNRLTNWSNENRIATGVITGLTLATVGLATACAVLVARGPRIIVENPADIALAERRKTAGELVIRQAYVNQLFINPQSQANETQLKKNKLVTYRQVGNECAVTACHVLKHYFEDPTSTEHPTREEYLEWSKSLRDKLSRDRIQKLEEKLESWKKETSREETPQETLIKLASTGGYGIEVSSTLGSLGRELDKAKTLRFKIMPDGKNEVDLYDYLVEHCSTTDLKIDEIDGYLIPELVKSGIDEKNISVIQDVRSEDRALQGAINWGDMLSEEFVSGKIGDMADKQKRYREGEKQAVILRERYHWIPVILTHNDKKEPCVFIGDTISPKSPQLNRETVDAVFHFFAHGSIPSDIFLQNRQELFDALDSAHTFLFREADGMIDDIDKDLGKWLEKCEEDKEKDYDPLNKLVLSKKDAIAENGLKKWLECGENSQHFEQAFVDYHSAKAVQKLIIATKLISDLKLSEDDDPHSQFILDHLQKLLAALKKQKTSTTLRFKHPLTGDDAGATKIAFERINSFEDLKKLTFNPPSAFKSFVDSIL